MPKPEVSVGDQLEQLLDQTKVSQRELARRLAAAEGLTGDDLARRWKTQLRWIAKVLKGEVKRPEPKSLRAIEKALKKPAGTIRRPDLEPREARETREASTERRLAALEEALQRLGPDLHDLGDLARRVLALEKKAQPRTRKAGPVGR